MQKNESAKRGIGQNPAKNVDICKKVVAGMKLV